MNTKLIRSIILAAIVLAGGSAVLPAAESPREDAAMAVKLITTIVKSDYEGFVSDGGAPFKQISKDHFMARRHSSGPSSKLVT